MNILQPETQAYIPKECILVKVLLCQISKPDLHKVVILHQYEFHQYELKNKSTEWYALGICKPVNISFPKIEYKLGVSSV